MGIAIIKKINEKTPYWMKAPFSKIIRNKLIKNSVFNNTMNMLITSDGLSEEQLKEKQLICLKDALIHAKDHSPYYRKLFSEYSFTPATVTDVEDIKCLPLLTKEILKENLDEIVTDDILDYYTVTTGGTTGEPTKVLMEKDAIYREWAFIYHYWSRFGYDYKTSKLATFRGVSFGKKISEINPLYREIRMNVFMMNNSNIHAYVSKIGQYGADFIYGYPSAVYNYCKLAQKAEICLKGKYKAVFLISENLYSFQEEKIREVLEVPIAMFYGHSERAVFAEKDDYGYEFNPLYGITEISEKGEPIVTGFINKKTPLIRYLVDDQVKEIDRSSFALEGHRNSEVIYGINGEEFRASGLDFHGSLSSIVPNYQFKQNEYGKLVVLVLKSDKVSNTQKKEVIKHCDEVLNGRIHTYLREVENLEYSNGSSRKYKLLIQNLHEGGVKDRYQISGHWYSETLIGKNGEAITAAEINVHDDTFMGIEAYQFIQKEPGRCMLNVVATGTLSSKELVNIKKQVNRKLSGILECEVSQVDSIPLSNRGKYKQIIQQIDFSNGSGGGIARKGNYYEILGHRDSEFLYGMKNEIISSAAINFHENAMDMINGYQFIQYELGKCEMHITASKRLSEDDLEKIRKCVIMKFGGSILCEIKQVDGITFSNRGKYKLIDQRIQLKKG